MLVGFVRWMVDDSDGREVMGLCLGPERGVTQGGGKDAGTGVDGATD